MAAAEQHVLVDRMVRVAARTLEWLVVASSFSAPIIIVIVASAKQSISLQTTKVFLVKYMLQITLKKQTKPARQTDKRTLSLSPADRNGLAFGLEAAGRWYTLGFGGSFSMSQSSDDVFLRKRSPSMGRAAAGCAICIASSGCVGWNCSCAAGSGCATGGGAPC